MHFRSIAFSLLLLPQIVFAQTATAISVKNLNSFKSLYKPVISNLQLPTRVKMNLPNSQQYEVAVIEEGNETPQPWARIDKVEKASLTISENSPLVGPAKALIDDNVKTFAEFNLDQDNGYGWAVLNASESFSSSFLSLFLDDNVALPYEIALAAEVNGKWKTIIARTHTSSSDINFPMTNAKKWKVEFWHTQPLRIRELNLSQSVTGKESGTEIVWLARPGKKYTVYADAQTYINIPTSETGNLLDEMDSIRSVALPAVEKNPYFKEPDDDGDGVINLLDNCVSIANVDQKDLDKNGRGDACEDHDFDHVLDAKDNCPNHPNIAQKDTDGDGKGDECDDQDSRVTEQLPWLPWTAMGLVGILLIFLIVHAMKLEKK